MCFESLFGRRCAYVLTVPDLDYTYAAKSKEVPSVPVLYHIVLKCDSHEIELGRTEIVVEPLVEAAEIFS